MPGHGDIVAASKALAQQKKRRRRVEAESTAGGCTILGAKAARQHSARCNLLYILHSTLVICI